MRRTPTVECSVEGCGVPRSSSVNEHCNRHRYLMDRYGSTDDPSFGKCCEHCGQEFWTTRRRARFCQESCRRARELEEKAARNANRTRIWVGRCGHCGKAFVSPTADGYQVRMCSDDCRAAAKRSKERIREHTQDIPRRKRYAESMAANDARRRGAVAVAAEVFSRAEIAERDGWVCQLCQVSVDPALEWPHPMSQSLDHKIPLSKGGAHSRANCQLAHLTCNLSKGDRAA